MLIVYSSKNVAHRIAPCIIFIDEVDAIFTARSNEKSCSRSDVQRSIVCMTLLDQERLLTSVSQLTEFMTVSTNKLLVS